MLLLSCTHTTMLLMKKTVLLIYFFLSLFQLQAQLPEGTYRNGSDSLCLEDQRAIFRLTGFAGLSVAQVGEGDYEQVGDFLIIHTGEYSGNKSSSRPLPASRGDSCVVKVVGSNHYPLPTTVLVESRNKSGKLIVGKVTDQEGKVIFTETDKIASLHVSSMGFNAHAIAFEPGNDYLVQLAENEVIEKRSVLLRCELVDEETISLLMLSDDFDIGKNRDRELEKLQKRARRSNRLDKRLKKEYVPYERKF